MTRTFNANRHRKFREVTKLRLGIKQAHQRVKLAIISMQMLHWQVSENLEGRLFFRRPLGSNLIA